MVLAYGFSLAGGIAAGSVAAQTVAPATAPNAAAAPAVQSDQIQEVVVTARKRKERLQDVPLAISAFGSSTLESAGVRTLQDLSALTPGMSVNDDGTESQVTPVIRGMAKLGEGDPNVAIFLDGIYLANPASVSLGLIDLERIEVVKGPVSSLYGRNAFAGAINYVSKSPTDYTSGSLSMTLGQYGMKSVTGSVGGSVIPGLLKGRIAIGYDKTDGTFKDNVTNLRAGGHEKKDAQVSFEMTPNKQFTINGALYYGKDFFGEPASVYLEDNCGPKILAGVTAGQFTQYCGEISSNGKSVEVAKVADSAGASGNDRKVTSGSLKFAYDFDMVDASALFGYNKVTQQRFSDFTGRRDGIPFALTTGGAVSLPELFGSDANNDDFSGEFRVSSKQNQRVRWSGGLYYFKAKNTASTLIGIDGSKLTAGQTLASATARQYLTSDGSFSQAYQTVGEGETRLLSEFVGGEFDILPNLTASAEGRHTKEDKSYDLLRSTAVANTVRPFGYLADAAFSYNNYRATLNWKATKSNLLYISSANGTKAGGYNPRATISSELTYNPETSDTIEIGSKNTFLNNRLQVNAAVYRIKSKDLQILAPSDNPLATGLVTRNFGGTTSKGVELEVTARPVNGVTLTGGVAYTNPKFDSGTYDFSNAAACAAIPSCAARVVTVSTAQGNRSVVDLNGLTPQRVSKVQTSLGVSYATPVLDTWTYFARVDARHETKQYMAPINLSYWGSRTVVNLRTGLESDAWRLAFFVTNLTDNRVPSYAATNTRLNDFVSNPLAYLPASRTAGVQVTYNF